MSTVTVTHTYTRPNDTVSFYTVYGSDPQKVAFRQHWANAYEKTGKVVSASESQSGNTYTVYAVYASQAAYDESISDSICIQMRASISSHNIANGIVEQTVVS